MLDLFAMLKKGHCDGVKVRLGRLQNLLSSSCIGEFGLRKSSINQSLTVRQDGEGSKSNQFCSFVEHLDFMNLCECELVISPFKQVVHEYSGYQSLTDVPKALVYHEPDYQFTVKILF